MKKVKPNYLLQAIIKIMKDLPRGKVLDLGCGDGEYSKQLMDLGFTVIASDIDKERFRYSGRIEFVHSDINEKLPFSNEYFDYLLLIEVIEHLKNPYTVIPEINRIIKKDGLLILSTPNILNLKSRLRFLFEGSYEYFREPPLDQAYNPKEKISNLHIIPYRYHELEYLLVSNGFEISDIFTSLYEGHWGLILLPFIKFQSWQKQRRSLKKGGIDYRRINRILFSNKLLFGKHLIVIAKKI
jgi:SAM-dependent methyltransferase